MTHLLRAFACLYWLSFAAVGFAAIGIVANWVLG